MSKPKYEDILKWITVIFSALLLMRPIINIINVMTNITAVSILYSGFNEVRDYASIRLANFIYQGINPYKSGFTSQTNVPLLPLYPASTPLLVAVLSRITGSTVMEGFYNVNILLDALTVLFLWMILRDRVPKDIKHIVLACTVVCAATFFCLFGFENAGNPVFNFHTDTIGICLSSLIFLVVYKKKENTILLAFLSVLLVFTKQILLVFVVPLFVLYLMIDRKLALKYFIHCAWIGVVTFIAVNIFFPLYWAETIYAQFFVNSSSGTISDSLKNIGDFYLRYIFLLLLVLAGTALRLIQYIRSRKGLNRAKDKEEGLGAVIRKEYFIIYLFLNLTFGTLSLLYFAKVFEDGYKYCQDLLAPSLFLLAVLIWDYDLKGSIAGRYQVKAVVNSVIILAISFASYSTYKNFWGQFFDRLDVAAYQRLDDVIEENSDGSSIYLGMGSTHYLVSRFFWEPDNIWFNDGQIEYFNEEYEANFLSEKVFHAGELYAAAREYIAEVNNMVENKEFSLITTCNETIIDMDTLEQNYYITAGFLIRTDQNGLSIVNVWLPKEDLQ